MENGAKILVVEDDKVDVQALRRAFRQRGAEGRLRFAENGEDALAALRSGSERPCLLVVDLALPRMSGIEVLAEMRAETALAELPVCVLSTSRNPPEMEQAAALGVLAILNKEDMGPGYEPLFEVLASVDGAAPNAGASKA